MLWGCSSPMLYCWGKHITHQPELGSALLSLKCTSLAACDTHSFPSRRQTVLAPPLINLLYQDRTSAPLLILPLLQGPVIVHEAVENQLEPDSYPSKWQVPAGPVVAEPLFVDIIWVWLLRLLVLFLFYQVINSWSFCFLKHPFVLVIYT